MAEIVVDRKMWFANIRSQDDIFEGNPLFEWEDPSWTKRGVRDLIRRSNPTLKPIHREAMVRRFVARLETPDLLAQMKLQIEEGLSQTYGQSSIASFFKSAVTQRHWADYASRGAGYGVVFDFSTRWNYVTAGGLAPGPMVPFPIEYVDPAARPRIKLAFRGFDPALGFEDVTKGLLMKSNEWQSQEEERLFRIGIPAGHVVFPAQSLVGILLGYDVSNAVEQEASLLGRQVRVPVVRVVRGAGYQLDLALV